MGLRRIIDRFTGFGLMEEFADFSPTLSGELCLHGELALIVDKFKENGAIARFLLFGVREVERGSKHCVRGRNDSSGVTGVPEDNRVGTTGVEGPGAKAMSPKVGDALKTKFKFFGFFLKVEQNTWSLWDGPKIINEIIFRSKPVHF